MIKPLKSIYHLLLALSVLFFAYGFVATPNAAYADTTYNRNASLRSTEKEKYPGVYYVKAEKGDTNATIGIPSIAKQTLENSPTTESPAIIMGAAVPYEKRTGFTEFTQIPGGSLYPPYSYFRYTITNEQNPNGTSGTHKKMSGFDGSYVFIRVDVSELLEGVDLEKSYLHVKQEKNKALMPSVIHVAWKDEDGFASFVDTAFGTKAIVYSLANNAASLKDNTGDDSDVPYVDILVYSSGTLVAGADTGSTAPDAMSADFGLKMYVDQERYYNETEYDPSYQPEQGQPTMADLMLAKYYNADQATDASYTIKGNDLELEIMVDKSSPTQYWSLRKALAYQDYNGVPIKMICEVPVLEGLRIDSGRDVIFDVNSFDIQIANHQATGAAGLTIENASLTLTDGFNTTGAELAVGNNASIVIKNGGRLVITEKCQLEVEYDAASAAAGSETPPPEYGVGVLTIEDGGEIINNGIITVEGTEGKPIDPLNPGARGDMKEAKFYIMQGGRLVNNGCLLCNGSLYNMGTLENNGRYDETITSQDPDKGSFTYHKGIQLSWKDDVTQKSGNQDTETQKSVTMGHLYNGINGQLIVTSAEVINNGDIVLVPGVLDNQATIKNNNKANIWICGVKEAVIPIQPYIWQPSVTEKRIAFEYPISSSMTNNDKGELVNDGNIAAADVKIVSNGRTGDLTPITEGEMFVAVLLNLGQMKNSGSVTVDFVSNFGEIENSGTIKNKIKLFALEPLQGKLIDTAATKLDNVFSGALSVNGDTNTWTFATCGSLTISPVTQESQGGKTVKWTARAETAEPNLEGVKYLVTLYEYNRLVNKGAEYEISAGTDETLESPPLPEVAVGQNIVYSFTIVDSYTLITQDTVVKVTETPIVIPPAPIPELVYNGEPQKLTTAGCWDEKPMQYRLNDGEWSDDIPSATNAGSYTVSYKPKDHPESEPKQVESEIIIAPCPVTLSADDMASMVGADLGTPAWTASGLPGREALNPEHVSISLEGVNKDAAGTYPITIKIAENEYPNFKFNVRNGNYYVTDTDFAFIAKDNYGVFQDDTTTATYKGYNIKLLFPTADKPENETPPEGITVYYSTEKALTKENYETDGVTALATLPAAAGTHTVYFYIRDTEGKISISGSKQVIITKAKQAAPDKLTHTDETYLNAGDGSIGGLTPRSMEYRDKFNNGTYKTIYEETIGVIPGTYLVRKMADENHYASPDTEVIVKRGGSITVSFDSAGGSAIADATVAACGDLVAKPAESPVLEGAKFLGWYLYGKEFDFANPVINKITLTAAWAPTDFVLPKSMTTIGASAFLELQVKAIGIPYGCTTIGENAFQDCTNLKVIVIPSSLTVAIPETAFSGCTQEVYVYGVNGSESSSGNSKAEQFCEKHDNFTFVGDISFPVLQAAGE